MTRLIIIVGIALSAAGLGCSDSGIGSKCKKHRDCKEVISGYCALTGVCTKFCDFDRCDDQSACTEVETDLVVCLRICEEHDDCQDNESCVRRDIFDSNSTEMMCIVSNPLLEPSTITAPP